MEQMNWTHYSRLLVSVLIGILFIGGIAGAVSLTQEGFGGSEIGSDVIFEATIEELYVADSNPIEVWTLRGESDLERVTWTIKEINAANKEISASKKVYTGAFFHHGVDLDSSVVKLSIEIAGTVPEVTEWKYNPINEVKVAEFHQVRLGGTSESIGIINTTQHTIQSKTARDAIELAESSIVIVGGDKDAEKTLENSISAYNVGNFVNSNDLAVQAGEKAAITGEESKRNKNLISIFGAIVILGIGIGILAWYRSTQNKSRL